RRAIEDGAIGRVCHVYAHWATGRLGNVGTHVFDAIRILLGTDPQAVSGRLDSIVPPDCRGSSFHDPGGWGVVEFPGRAKAYVDATSDATVPMAIQVTGTTGRVDVGPTEAVLEHWDGERQVLPHEVATTSAACRAVDEIVSCLDGDATPSSTGEDGRQALEMIVGFHVSHRLDGQRVSLPIQQEDRALEVQAG
ncbi:MAG TPA: Gfo/Idh/MocA family oxidoreductase, partial [Armatimonadota bacterium]|nr:Gfo/Idh/MocA family oxidoreductase [Armatimonadota bacterium]